MRAIICGALAVALVACGGSAQTVSEALSEQAPASGGDVIAAAPVATQASAGQMGVAPTGTPRGMAGAGGAEASAGAAGASAPSAAAGATAASAGGAGGQPGGGADSGGAAATAGALAGSAGSVSDAPSGGAGGATTSGTGTIVVTWTVGGRAFDGGSNPDVCACLDAYGHVVAGYPQVVLAFGVPGAPRDRGRSTGCGDVSITLRNAPIGAFEFTIRDGRSPSQTTDPAAMTSATVEVGKVTTIAVDFPATGATGSTASVSGPL